MDKVNIQREIATQNNSLTKFNQHTEIFYILISSFF